MQRPRSSAAFALTWLGAQPRKQIRGVAAAAAVTEHRDDADDERAGRLERPGHQNHLRISTCGV